MMKVTIKDIADACDVSKATVSRFINGSGYVSKDVADRLAGKIEELNYVPSATARSLSTKKSNVIGVIIPEVSNPFFAEIFKGISEIADKHDLNIFYCDTDNDGKKELKALNMLRSHEICGIILTPATGGLIDHEYNSDFVNAVKSLNVPVVLLDRDIEYVDWDGVFIDNFKGAYDSTQLLIKNGHKDIAIITGNRDLLIGQERFKGYMTAMYESDLTLHQEFIIEGDFTTETAYTKTINLLKLDKRPTAIFTSNNLTTLGVLKAFTEQGIRIPEDIAIVGFDDIAVLQLLNICLTVVHRDTVDMGRKAMELLIDNMKDSNMNKQRSGKKIIIEPEIIIRGSERLIKE
jgi:LacI family transcriptional regulator